MQALSVCMCALCQKQTLMARHERWTMNSLSINNSSCLARFCKWIPNICKHYRKNLRLKLTQHEVDPFTEIFRYFKIGINQLTTEWSHWLYSVHSLPCEYFNAEEKKIILDFHWPQIPQLLYSQHVALEGTLPYFQRKLFSQVWAFNRINMSLVRLL